MLRALSVLVLVAAVGACSSSVDPQSIDGLWSDDFTVPGSFQDMVLSHSGSTLSGNGNWCGEAIACATTTETGTINGIKVHLVTTFSNGIVQTFEGHLASGNSLTGSVIEVSSGGQPQPARAQNFHHMADPV